MNESKARDAAIKRALEDYHKTKSFDAFIGLWDAGMEFERQRIFVLITDLFTDDMKRTVVEGIATGSI